MTKEKTVTVSCWSELIELVESINTQKQTIILSGYVNQIFGDSLFIDKIVFTTKPVEILVKKDEQKGTKEVQKSKVDK